MSKLNPLVKESKKFDDSVRLAGGMGLKAAKQDNISLLRRCVLANLLWENNAYVDGVEVAKQISALIPLCEPADVYNLAIEARLNQKLRHTPLYIAVEMLKHAGTKGLVASLLPKIITRADMLTDFVALYSKMNPKAKGAKRDVKLASSAKRGLAAAFANFKEYHFAKYDRDAGIKLRDVMFMVHPKAENADREALYKRLADRELITPDTWEVALSTGKDKKETWTRLIQEEKLGGLAMLRNIANMMKSNVDKKVIKEGLTSLKAAMLLPLDFLKTARMNPEFSREIEGAMINSYKNLPKLKGKTLFIVDISGSMGHTTSSGTAFTRLDQACAMAMLAVNQCEDYDLVATSGSDSSGKHATAIIKYPESGFGIAKQITDNRAKLGGGGIFTRQCLEWCKENTGSEYDRIIVFSDSQDCDRANRIPKPFGKYNYICDVSAHKNGVNFKGVWDAEITGFSEKFITYIAAMEGVENKFEETQE
jgi:60 kDa SS-A/Ro ribonucleoprotein